MIFEDNKEIKEMVNHPSHYQSDGGMEVIDVIKNFVPDFNSFCAGNVIKYVLRAGKKGNMEEDLKKADWYLNRMIDECK